jgi:hypothetical protein
VVTQRSAKPFTPVQFRAWPPPDFSRAWGFDSTATSAASRPSQLIGSIAMTICAACRYPALPELTARGVARWLPILVLLGGCAGTQEPWTRSDGSPILAGQLALDEKACDAQRQQANDAANTEPGLVFGENGLHSPRAEAYDAVALAYAACMAQRGYSRAPQ